MASIDWHDLARAQHLAVLCDLDGTLIPFAGTLGEAQLDDDGTALLAALAAAPGTTVAVISGRPRAWIAELAARLPTIRWVAEHGAWRLEADGWHPVLHGEAPLDGLAGRLAALVAMAPGARLERKSWSVCAHWRMVNEPARSRFIEAAGLMMDEWLEEHAEFERLGANEATEVRHRAVHKGVAVGWLRRQLPPDTRLITIGDDQTDEDMFQAVQARDVAVGVAPGRRATHADVAVADVAGVRAFLRWLIAHRTQQHPSDRPSTAPPMSLPVQLRADQLTTGAKLVVVSNRLPNPPATAEARKREAGGLVSALEPALIQHGGVWLGWSGHEREPGLDVIIEPDAQPVRASFHYPPGWREKFYAGLCNGSLWPLLHGFPTRLRYRDDDWRVYEAANRAYAVAARELAAPDASIWLHDYHLLLAGRELREIGHRGPIGLFLHVPFPPRDVFETLPWAGDLLAGMLDCDVLGFHTQRWADNFLACARLIAGAQVSDRGLVSLGDRRTKVEVIPVGIDPAAFAGEIHKTASDTFGEMQASLGERRMVLGVDRLDYTKGIPERLEAFGRLLETFPEWRRTVSLIQVSVPSRSDVPEYAELRHRVENLVGRINGEHGEADWVPVRYLYRSYDRTALAQLYRSADVGLVTPLRDGMNLVAKEYVASQDPDDPGVLVLSRFAGAAEHMPDAVLTNPFHTDGVARDLDRALRMPLDERRRRWRSCQDEVERNTANRWAERFLSLLNSRPDRP
jgi:alpha,alpha-trehalose-phosphate synthase [UDP-forming]/trehalose-phosphatase